MVPVFEVLTDYWEENITKRCVFHSKLNFVIWGEKILRLKFYIILKWVSYYILKWVSQKHVPFRSSLVQDTSPFTLMCKIAPTGHCNLFSTMQLEDTFKSMLDYVPHLLKTFQWLPVWLKVKTRVCPSPFCLSPSFLTRIASILISSYAPLCWMCCNPINPLMFFKTPSIFILWELYLPSLCWKALGPTWFPPYF